MAQIEYRTLGNSGLVVSTIGLGCNNFGRNGTSTEGQAGTSLVIDAAIDTGVTCSTPLTSTVPNAGSARR